MGMNTQPPCGLPFCIHYITNFNHLCTNFVFSLPTTTWNRASGRDISTSASGRNATPFCWLFTHFTTLPFRCSSQSYRGCYSCYVHLTTPVVPIRIKQWQFCRRKSDLEFLIFEWRSVWANFATVISARLLLESIVIARVFSELRFSREFLWSNRELLHAS